MTTKIAIAGAKGRMGENLIRSGLSNQNTQIVGVFDVTDIDETFLKKVGLPNTVKTSQEESFIAADAVIDFTSPPALFSFTESAVANNTSLIVGTTGLEKKHFKLLEQAGKSVKVFYAPNMSFGVNSFFNLARKAASQLKSFDIEIIESHHKDKVDAPSGTALSLGESVAKSSGRSLKEHGTFKRTGIMASRKRNEIGFSVIRGGDIVGDHTVLYAGDGERIELTHKASNRKTFAKGALRAAKFLADKTNGLFDMQDVLGLKQ